MGWEASEFAVVVGLELEDPVGICVSLGLVVVCDLDLVQNPSKLVNREYSEGVAETRLTQVATASSNIPGLQAVMLG